MTTAPETDIAAVDPEAVGAFIQQVFGCLIGGKVALLLDVAHRAGLFEAAAGAGPLTSAELAARIEGSERHVRELVGGLASAGVFTYDPETRAYTLPPAHAAALTGPTSMNVAPVMGILPLLAGHVPAVTRTVLEGGGIPYAAYRPEFTSCMDQMMRRIYDDLLLDGYVASVPGLHDKLAAGADVADLGCGTGHTTNLLARAYPASQFTGYDIAADALAAARAEAAAWGLSNVSFVEADVAELARAAELDVIVAFDAIHDQARPGDVLARARRALRPGGIFMAVDVGLSSNVEDNVGNPVAPWMYATSLFHCMQVSLAEGGAGLGTAWGRQLAARMLSEAGFESVEVLETPPQDVTNALYVGRA